MPPGSHQWCARCHKVRVDKRAGYGMCPRCKRIHQDEIRKTRHAIKTRRAQRRQGVAPMPESVQEHTPTEPSPNGTAKRSYRPDPNLLGQETMLEIGAHYEDRRITTEAIARAFGISNAMLSAVVDALGLTRRGIGNTGLKPRGHFTAQDGKRVWVLDEPIGPPPIPATATEARALAATPPVPDETLVALERMIDHTPKAILPPKPEPPVQHRPQLATDASSVVWEVQVSGLIHVTGAEITDAIAAVQGIYPKLRITGIRQA